MVAWRQNMFDPIASCAKKRSGQSNERSKFTKGIAGVPGVAETILLTCIFYFSVTSGNVTDEIIEEYINNHVDAHRAI